MVPLREQLADRSTPVVGIVVGRMAVVVGTDMVGMVERVWLARVFETTECRQKLDSGAMDGANEGIGMDLVGRLGR